MKQIIDFFKRNWWIFSLSLLIGFIVGIRNRKVETVTVEKPYPVTVEKPVPVHDTVYSTKTVYLPKVKTEYDTVTETVTTTVYIHDTVQVQVPISMKEYEETVNDAQVNIKISGFEPNLESLTVTNLKICPQTNRKAPYSRFGIGVEVGYGFTLKNTSDGLFEPRPYVGVGIHYSLIQF